jgi:Tol biopolymer transport system component
MPLTSSTRLGPYEIVSPLGRGGMGEVFLARDTRLGRDVAIKALPDAFAHDPERLARFEREARLLASLQHPNIAAIYGLEESEGRRYLILEYVPGPTLAERLAQGSLPLEDTLDFCAQIAAGLEAAHESGVVHRDLKPANVKLTPGGDVKVLDFGLAKSGAGSASGPSLEVSNSPTMTQHAATSAGVILGTAAYMSPEQARGKTVDRRTDIWSFGCVLYECLMGKALHQGETVSDLIAQILQREPDLSVLPAHTPPRLRDLLARCLRKDPRERQRDIGDARLELAEIRAGRDGRAASGAPASAARPGRERLAWSIAALAALVAGVAPFALRIAPPASVPGVRFTIQAPPGTELVLDKTPVAISPDGSRIAFIASDSTGAQRIWLRPLQQLTAVPVAGTEDANALFWSPDSRTLGFFADGKLHTIPAQGGTRQTLADAPDARGGSWSVKGRILFAPVASGPLMSVPAEGGEVTLVATPDSTRHETALRYPSFLPDGDHFTCLELPRRPGGEHEVLLGSLSDPRRHVLFLATNAPVHAPSGHLLYTHLGVLMAQGCDAHGRLHGKPVKIGMAPAVRGPDGLPAVSVSAGDVLVHPSPFPNTRLTWFDRNGVARGVVPLPPDYYGGLRLSPDGRRAVIERGSSAIKVDLDIVDLERGVSRRFVSSSDFVSLNDPLWSPDASHVVFGSFQDGPKNLYIRASDGAGPVEPFFHSDALFKNVYSWSPDGRFIVFSQPDPGTGWDVWMLGVDDRKAVPLLATPASEQGGWISPDGHWIAYTSDETGRKEAYVMPFPGGGNSYQVTTTGAATCAWRQDGRELMAIGAEGNVRVAEVDPGPPFRISPTRFLFKVAAQPDQFRPTPDFQRILVCVPAPDAEPEGLMVEMGWRR